MKRPAPEIIALLSADPFDIVTLHTLQSHRSQGAVGREETLPTSSLHFDFASLGCSEVEKQLKAVSQFS